MAGFGGSLHCVGMCGGLVAASCDRSQDVVKYQVGRLLGYLGLGLFAGYVGSLLNIKALPLEYSIIPGILIGLLFVFWGVQNFRGRKAELPTPKFLGKIYSKLWMKLVHRNQTVSKAFFTGLISILLPCGLLYGVVLGTVALQHTTDALLSMFFFWLGTVPSMVVAPGVVRKFLAPLKKSLPKTYAVSLMMIGVMTISFRVAKLADAPKEVKAGQTKVHHCH